MNKRKGGKSWRRGRSGGNRGGSHGNHGNHGNPFPKDLPGDSEFGRNAYRDRQPRKDLPAYPQEDSGNTLQRIVELVGEKKTGVVLDLTSGVGHTGFAVAPHVKQVVICDEKPTLFPTARKIARKKELENISLMVSEFGRLPFADGTFNAVVARATANRFQDVRECVRECSRVTKKGGRVIIVDNIVPPDEEVDRFLNELERNQNPAHVRFYNVREWQVLLADSGLKLKTIDDDVVEGEEGQVIDDWLARAGTNPVLTRRITGMLVSANSKIKEAINFKVDSGEMRVQPRKVVVVGAK